MSEIQKAYSVFSKIKMDGTIESLQRTMDSCVKIDRSYLKSGMCFDTTRTVIESFANSFAAYEQYNISESLKAIQESMCSISGWLESDQLRKWQGIDFSVIFNDIVPKATTLPDIVETVYSMVQDELVEEDEVYDSFSQEEVHKVLAEQINNPEGFQARFAEWTEKKKIQIIITKLLLQMKTVRLLKAMLQSVI